MGFWEILGVIKAALDFPAELRAFIKLISKSPAEKRAEILERVMKESDSIDHGGRPQWEE